MADNVVSLIFLALYGLGIYYCHKVAKQLGMNQIVAIMVGVVLPLGGVLIYNHLSYRHKNGTAPRKDIFK